jgi:uncharacterized repeat protein (TIGR03806 family)
LYFTSISELATETGRVYRLRRARDEEMDAVPETLAETGINGNVTSTGLSALAEHFAPYEINVPFWSDGAEKRRWISVPGGKRVTQAADGSLTFPPGTVLVKHFELATDQRKPNDRRPLETRVLVCDDMGGVYGATYRWDDDGQRRLVTFAESEEIDVTLVDGKRSRQTWVYPGRFDCAQCHNASSGHVLGFNLKQLNRDVVGADGTTRSQLALLDAAGVLAPQVAAATPSAIPRLARLNDESATLEYRVRSYLDVNCSSCHNPRTRFAAFDARIERDPNEQGLVGGTSHHHRDLGPLVNIVRPGDLDMSVLYVRIASEDPCMRMPPLGSTVVDRAAARLFAKWIQSLPPALITADSHPNPPVLR